MNLHFGARRAVRRPSSALPPIEDRNLDPVIEDDTLSPDPDWSGGGLVAHYALRRKRAERLIASNDPPADDPDVHAIGRGTPEHASALGIHTPAEPPRPRRRISRKQAEGATSGNSRPSLRQRLIAAGLAIAVCVSGFAGHASAQQRYVVQPGDTLDGVAAEFGVDPEAILRSSWLANPPELTPGDVIIIPNPGQSPDEAAAMAADLAGTSPWTAGVYWVEDGDSIDRIAASLGVDAQSMLDLNGLSWSDYIYAGQRLLIPGDGDTSEVAGSGEAQFDAYVWVPEHQQEHGLSCEYASAFIATSAFGNAIPESVFIDSIPVALNPHYGFRGDIDGRWGEYDDWGIYAEPLVSVLNEYGFAAEAFYSMGDPSELKAHLDAGHPVVVWLAMWGDTGRVYHDEDTYTVFAGSHVMTAYGYNADGVFLSNPGNGTYTFMTWDTFIWMWGTIDGMSLAIYPF